MVFSCVTFFAQDTIFIKTSETLLVRVLEISKEHVTYKNFYNPDGIIRKLNNEQILKIVYENGKTETLFQLKNKTSASPLKPSIFVIEGKHIALNNSDISHKNAFKIMLKNQPQTNSEELNGALVDAESKKNAQVACIVLAPTFAIGGIYFARQHRYNDPTERMKAKVYFISGLSACLVAVITSQIYKSIKNKHIRKAALLYNDEIL